MKIEKAVLKSRNIVRPAEYPLEYELLPKGKERHFSGRHQFSEEQQASGRQPFQIRIWGSTGNMTLWEGDWDVYLYTEEGEILPVILDGAHTAEASLWKLRDSKGESYFISNGKYESYAYAP